MINQQEIARKAAAEYRNYTMQEESAFEAGATWANEQNAQEIAELVEALQLVTDQFSKLEKIYSRDRKIIGKCRELLSKYEK